MPAQALKMFAVISLDVGNADGKEGGIKEDSQKWYLLYSNMAEIGLESIS